MLLTFSSLSSNYISYFFKAKINSSFIKLLLNKAIYKTILLYGAIHSVSKLFYSSCCNLIKKFNESS